MFQKLGRACFPLCTCIENRHAAALIYISLADCYLAAGGYHVGEINKSLSSQSGADDEGASDCGDQND